MHFKDLFHGFNWHKLKPKKELTEVYISISLRYLAYSMINLFVPLYLYDRLGYSLNQTLGFFIVYAVAFGVFTLIAAKLMSRIGVKHTILASVPFYLVFYLLLYSLGSFTFIPFYVVPIFFAMAQSFFWMGFHSEFIKTSDRNHRGRDVSKYISLAYLAVLVGPFLGGLLIDNFGFALLFVAVAILFFISAFFLFFTGDFRQPAEIKFRHVFSKENLKDSFTYICYGAQTMCESVLWPLFIFVVLKTYTNLGLLGSAMSAVIALMTYLIGRTEGRIGKRKILHLGGIIYSLTWVVRNLFSSIGFVFGLTMFAGFSYTFVHTPLETLTYNKVEKNVGEMLAFREIALNMGRILPLLVVMLTGKFIYAFFLVAGVGIGYFFF